MTKAPQRGLAIRVAAIAIAGSCPGVAAIAQTNAPATNAPPASTGGAARQGGTGTAPPPATGAPATPPAAAAPTTPPAAAAPATPPGTAAAGEPVRICPT